VKNEYGRKIQYDPDGPIYDRPSEAEIHEANQLVWPRGCDCLRCLAKRGEQMLPREFWDDDYTAPPPF
jgi:hypothetical protein